MSKAPAQRQRLKVKIPFGIEAEAEGLGPVVCVVALCALFLVLTYLGIARGS